MNLEDKLELMKNEIIAEASAELDGKTLTFYDQSGNKVKMLGKEHQALYNTRIKPYLAKNPKIKAALSTGDLKSYDFVLMANDKIKVTDDNGKVIGMI